MAWVDYSLSNVMATVFVDKDLFEAALEHWQQAWVTVEAPRQQRKGNKYLQAAEWASSPLDFPFGVRLAQVTRWDKDAPAAVVGKRWLTEADEDDMGAGQMERDQREEERDRTSKRTRQEAEEDAVWGHERGSSSGAWNAWS